MRWPRTIPVIVAAAALCGCGDRHLVLKVDVLSYMDPSTTQFSFGPIPAVPGGFYTGEQPVVQDVQVNLVEGTSSVAEVQSVSLSMSTIATDSTGAGEDTLRLYVSDVNTDPLTTTPVVVLPMVFAPGVTDTASVDLAGDSRVADLFTSKRMRMTLTTALRGPSSGPDLNGRVQINRLDAVIVAGRKGM